MLGRCVIVYRSDIATCEISRRCSSLSLSLSLLLRFSYWFVLIQGSWCFTTSWAIVIAVESKLNWVGKQCNKERKKKKEQEEEKSPILLPAPRIPLRVTRVNPIR